MADQRTAKLILSVETKGANEASASIKQVGTGATTLQQELGKISRADQFQKIAVEMGTLARKTKDVGGAVAELDKRLKELGANKDEIAGVAGAFDSAQSGASGGGGNRLASFGNQLRSLPSTQIPGLGIGTDAIANVLRLGGALGGVSEKVGLVTTVATALTPALGATAAGIVGITVAAAPFVLAIAAIGLALKALGDQAAKEADTINSIIDAQRSVAQDIANGLTTDEAEEKLRVLNAERKAEADLLAKNQQVYRENIENQGALTAVIKATSGAEEALSGQIATSTENVTNYDTQIAALTLATQNGSLAANDAAEAEKRLAEERSKNALASADTAGKELAAQQKALAATEEQNTKRLESIDNEKEVIQRQIDVLTESGVTSEDVTAKIAALNGQLGSLGKESDFIKETALAVSRENDAAKKAVKDREDAEKKAAQQAEQYTKAVQSATTAYKNSVQDIGTRLRQTLADNTAKLNRDLIDLSTKQTRDEYDLQLKANRAERDVYQDQQRDLLKIQKDGDKSLRDALQEGDFKAAFIAKRDTAEQINEAQQDAQAEAQQRRQDSQDAFEDLRRANERQRSDRMLNYERQNVDARTAQDRELQQARLTRQRALQVASEGQNAELKMIAGYWQQRLKIEQQGQSASLKMASGGGPNMPKNAPQAFSFAVGNVIRK